MFWVISPGGHGEIEKSFDGPWVSRHLEPHGELGQPLYVPWSNRTNPLFFGWRLFETGPLKQKLVSLCGYLPGSLDELFRGSARGFLYWTHKMWSAAEGSFQPNLPFAEMNILIIIPCWF